MNIFFLHRDPSRAARAQCDKHVVKMVLETTQMLSTAARRNGFDRGYKSSYPNHPMTIWVGDNDRNFSWAIEHAQALSKEYTARYSKLHACQKVINEFLSFRNGNYMHFQNHHSACRMNLKMMTLFVLIETIIYIKLVIGNYHQNGLKV